MDKIKPDKQIVLVLHADYVTTLLQTLTGTGNLCVRVHRKVFSFLRGMNNLTVSRQRGVKEGEKSGLLGGCEAIPAW